MSSLQPGLTSSQLSPQNFRNSAQSGSVQNTDNPSGSQLLGGNLSLISGSALETTLVVVDSGSGQNVLGSSTSISTPTQQPIRVDAKSISLGFPLAIILTSFVLCVYFYRKFSRLASVEES